jgi:hypothetical protein
MTAGNLGSSSALRLHAYAQVKLTHPAGNLDLISCVENFRELFCFVSFRSAANVYFACLAGCLDI